MRDAGDLGAVLVGLEQAVADTRSMARTVERAGPLSRRGIPASATPGSASSAAPATRSATPTPTRCAASATTSRTPRDELPEAGGNGASRPVHGALLVNLRNILEAMAPVAAAQPVRVRSRRDLARTSRYG